MQIQNEKQYIKEKFTDQICCDCNCKPEDVLSEKNVFTPLEELQGRRRFHPDDTAIKIICVNGKVICSAKKEILPECRELFYDANGAWFSEFSNLCKLEGILSKIGYTIDYEHHFYLPLGVKSIAEDKMQEFKDTVKLKWYENEEIEAFRKDNRFRFALSFLDNAPDMLALTAESDGEILGMCGVSRDSEQFWQVGIDVLPNVRGKRIGACLTILMKNEVLKRGKIPFYGTAQSHIQSQSVAVKSGFVPGWYELQSGRKNP